MIDCIVYEARLIESPYVWVFERPIHIPLCCCEILLLSLHRKDYVGGIVVLMGAANPHPRSHQTVKRTVHAIRM